MDGLVLDSLSLSFAGKHALNKLSFEVPQGEIFGFLGPNGSGKTTTMRVIFGLLTPDSGEVRYDGQRLTRAVSKHFGYMPAERGLYKKMTVADQLGYFGRLHGLNKECAKKKPHYWLKRFGLADQSRAKIETLSLGNQKKVQLIVALSHDPQVLILDEPFSGLDPIATTSMVEVMHEIVKTGRTLIFSSHQLDLVESICNKVVIIKDGSLVINGEVSKLLQSDNREIEMVTSSRDLTWITKVPGVEGYVKKEGRVHVNLAQPGVSQDLLQAALAEGELKEFAFRRKKLSEIFEQAVRDTSVDTEVRQPTEVVAQHG